jgi:hypothetical protein
MAKGNEVLRLLIPTGGWVIYEDDFDSIRYDEGVTPITRKQFDEGFAQVDALKTEQADRLEADKEAAQSKLAALGLTADDLRALGL